MLRITLNEMVCAYYTKSNKLYKREIIKSAQKTLTRYLL